MITLNVSVADVRIAGGKPRRVRSCPLALAIAEACHDVGLMETEVSVGLTSFGVKATDSQGKVRKFPFTDLPERARQFVRELDGDGPTPGPFKFEVELREGHLVVPRGDVD